MTDNNPTPQELADAADYVQRFDDLGGPNLTNAILDKLPAADAKKVRQAMNARRKR